MGGTFHFSQTSAPPVEEARAVPFYVGSPELVQNTGNEEHTTGKRADLPLRVWRADVQPSTQCQMLGNSGEWQP